MYMHLFLAYSARNACSSRPNASHIYNAKCTAHMRSHDLVRIRSVLCVCVCGAIASRLKRSCSEQQKQHQHMKCAAAQPEASEPGLGVAKALAARAFASVACEYVVCCSMSIR